LTRPRIELRFDSGVAIVQRFCSLRIGLAQNRHLARRETSVIAVVGPHNLDLVHAQPLLRQASPGAGKNSRGRNEKSNHRLRIPGMCFRMMAPIDNCKTLWSGGYLAGRILATMQQKPMFLREVEQNPQPGPYRDILRAAQAAGTEYPQIWH